MSLSFDDSPGHTVTSKADKDECLVCIFAAGFPKVCAKSTKERYYENFSLTVEI